MLIYDKAYMDLKNKYLVPLTKYAVPYSHLRKTNIKNIILTKSTSIDIPKDNEYIFHFDESCLLKGLLGDIELFYIRQIVQKRDAELCEGLNVSSNWNIVTYYYRAFFAASLMLRLCYRGNIFFELELKRNIEKLISNITGNVVKLESNQFYEVIVDNGGYALKITPMTDGTHELVWKKMDSLIDDMLLLTRKKSEEAIILLSVKEINHKLRNTYPSQLRNRVNYQPIYGLQYLDKKLFPINEKISWVNQLIDFADTDDDNQIACCMYAYSEYMEWFCSNFLAEYYDIRGNENGIMKRINDVYNGKISKCENKYNF